MFRAAHRPLHRRAKPRAVKGAIAGLAVILSLGMFTHWVIGSEQASEAALAARPLVAAADEPVDAAAHADAASASSGDRRARHVLDAAAAVAGRRFDEHASFASAGPAQLSAVLPASTFVYGPSLAPSVVSIATTPHAWAAAVTSSSGACYLIRVRNDRVTRGIGTTCTGQAALNATHARHW